GAPLLCLTVNSVVVMLAIGHWAAGLPGAVQAIPSAPAAALPGAFLGILFMCLWRGPGRRPGLPLGAAVVLWPPPAPPDALLRPGGAEAAARPGQQGARRR